VLAFRGSGRMLVTRVSKPEFTYLSINLELDSCDQDNAKPSVIELKVLISKALEELHGEIGKSIPVDVLRYVENDGKAILRTPHKSVVKVLSALTLCGMYKDLLCAFRINQISNHLIELGM
jgi:RNase P/RNase MRP subunit POP5